MAKPTKRRRSKKRRPAFFQKFKFPLYLLVAAAVLLGGLVYFAQVTEEQPAVPKLPTAAKPAVDDSRLIYDAIETFLAGLPDGKATIQRDSAQVPSKYIVDSTPPQKEALAELSRRLRLLPGTYSLLVEDRNTLHVDKGGVTQITIRFTLPPVEIPQGPLMTIIMDDLGRSRHVAEEVSALAEPVTFSVLPGESQAAQVARIAHDAGREVMLHVPMEPQGYPAVNPGTDALFVKYRSEDIRVKTAQLLTIVPYVTGANNHMGSRFTEDARALTPVMEVMKERDLFFIDSRTTGQSKVPEVAASLGVPTLSRDVFLDNVADVDAIVREIRRLESRARQKGQAIGICHPYPETLEALRRELPEMKSRGINVVPVSVLLLKQSLAQGS